MTEDNVNGVDTSVDSNTSEDPIKQLKGEFSRKTDKLADSLTKMQQSNEQLANMLNQLMQPKSAQAAPKAEDLASIMYSDPNRYAQIIKEQTKNELREESARMSQSQNATQSTIAQLARDYPELNDTDSDLTRKSVEFLNKYSPEERNTPMAYRLAVKEAAEALEVKVKSKRPVEDFGGSTNQYGSSRSRVKADKLTPETEFMAEALGKNSGIDFSDPKVKARMLERQKRDSWLDPKEPVYVNPKRKK